MHYAVRHSVFYREKFRGINLNKCRIEDLPTTTKADIMAHFDDVVTDPRVRRADVERFIDDPANVGRLLFDNYPVCHTSGSQGQPLLIVQDPLAVDLVFAFHMTRGNVGFGPLEVLRRLAVPARLAIIISRQGFFPSAWVWQHMPQEMARYLKLLYVTGSDPDLIAKLRDFRPTAISATPTTLDLLAPQAKAFDSYLRQVATWSETLNDATRQRLQIAYGAPVLDTYGCGECLFLSTGCRTQSGAHINSDWVILENVNPSNHPVPAGELGHHVLLTNLANRVQPLIRYELGDQLIMATEPCHCGSQLPRIERILGRAGDVFRIRVDGEIKVLSAYPFQHAFDFLRDVREWQAIHCGENRIDVRFELLPEGTLDLELARRLLNERLQMAGFGNALAISFHVVPRLEADTRTGKIRRMVCHVSQPN